MLVTAGVGAACWLIGMLFATTAHAAEAPADAGANPAGSVLSRVVSNTPIPPSPPGPPAGSPTGTTHTQDSSHHGKQPGVLADTVDTAVRLTSVTGDGESASGEADLISARPGASPD